jgi:hemoglobin
MMRSWAFLLWAVAVGCAHSATSPPNRSLYERLGGKDAITAVVNDFVGRVGQDERINQRFANAEVPRLKQLLVEQICQAAGGPCQYSGRDMKTAHKGMGIRDEEFGALVEDLVASLAQLKVPEPEQKELLGALAGLKGDIVGQ